MRRLIVSRVLALVPTMLLVSLGVFLLSELVPGDAALRLAGGDTATPERVEQVREQLKLDEPVLERYADWVIDAVQMDFGTSLFSRQPVSDEIVRRLPVTVGLTLAAGAVGLLIGLALGVAAGLRTGGWIDQATRAVASLGIAVPNFVLATILVVVLAVWYRLLPSAGYVPFTESPLDWARHMAMPALVLGVAVAAAVARQLRVALAEVLNTNYVRTAWAKGAPGRIVVGRHALKNAALPAVTVFGLQIGRLLGGTVIVEQIFSLPGLGSLLVDSIISDDFPVLQAITLLFVAFQLGMNLVVDLVYGWLNPKIRLADR